MSVQLRLTAITVLLILSAPAISIAQKKKSTGNNSTVRQLTSKPDSVSGYADVNGLHMYYEIHGKGQPLVLIHGGGSTIQTTFGEVLPLFAQHRQVIAVELQAHGHTADRNAPLSFDQDAADVAALLQYLRIPQADIFGFSNGGSTAMHLAISHPELVRKLIVTSTFAQKEGAIPGLFTFIEKGSFSDMPLQLKQAFLKVNNDTAALRKMHDRDKERVLHFKDLSDKELQQIKAPTLLLSGDRDIVQPEHLLHMGRQIKDSRIAIVPGTHGQFIGEIVFKKQGSLMPAMIVAMVEEFLDNP